MLTITFRLNGRETTVDCGPQERLIDLLREKLACAEVKEGCGEGECGACTILLDGQPVTSCAMFAWAAHGRSVVTVKGIAPAELERIRKAMTDEGAVQCGFCTPGFVLTIKALLDRGIKPDRGGIMAAVSGNLCRCTGYENIARAIEALTGVGGTK